MLAVTEMLFHGRPQGRVDLLLNIVRNLAPYFLARYYHGFFPFTKLNRLFQLPPSPGASKSRNMRRARNKSVFTLAMVMSSAFPVSALAQCLPLLQIKTLRTFF